MIENIIKPAPGKCRWYEIFATESSSTPISFKNNRIYSVVERQNSGAGVRVNCGGRTGFAHTNNAGRIDEAMQAATGLAPYGDIEEFALPAENPAPGFEPFSGEIDGFSLDAEIETGKRHIGRIISEFPGVQVDLSIGVSRGAKRIINSEGLDCSHRYSVYSVSIASTSVFGNGVRLSVSEGYSSLKPEDYSGIVEKLLWKMGHAQEICAAKSGNIPAIVTPKAFSSLLGILLSGMSARAVFKGISPFSGKLGKKIMNEKFTLTDDPLVRGSAYSYPFDDEGVKGETKTIIGRGEILSYLSDLKYADLLGIQPSGNASRGYASLPAISFSNVIVMEGKEHHKKLISEIANGLLVDQFIGLGQSNTLTGDFSANLDLAYMIEKGEITGRVKDCMITGNLFDLLSGDLVLSSEREYYGSVLVPYVYFPSVNFTI